MSANKTCENLLGRKWKSNITSIKTQKSGCYKLIYERVKIKFSITNELT